MTFVLSDLSFEGVSKIVNPVLVALGLQTSEPSSPPDGALWAESFLPAIKTRIAGKSKDLFADIGSAFIWKAIPGSVNIYAIGLRGPTQVGTATIAVMSTANKHQMTPRLDYLVTTASTSAVAGYRGTLGQVTVGGPAADEGGFRFGQVWGPATGVATTTHRCFMGLTNNIGAPTDVQPSTVVNCCGMGWDAADANIQMIFNDGSGTATKVDLGSSFPVPTVDRTSLYKLEMFSPKGTTQAVYWRVTDLVSGAVATGVQTTDLPSTTTLMQPRGWMSVGGTSSVIGIALVGIYIDPLI